MESAQRDFMLKLLTRQNFQKAVLGKAFRFEN